MERKNKVKLIAMAGTCIACIMVPASLAFSDYADDLLVDSYYNDILDVVGRQDGLVESDKDILIEEDSLIENKGFDNEDILLSDSGSELYEDDLLISDDGYYNSKSDILTGSTPAYDPASINEEVLITKPVITTPTPTPKPADAKSVKAAMAPVTGPSYVNDEATTGKDGTAAAASTIDTVVREVNARRAAAGVAPLSSDTTLNYVATQRVKETTKKFSHTRPNGRESVTILSDYGVSAGRTGENIACCIASPEGVVSAWANSPSHNRCMLNPDYSHAGVGTIVSDGVTYWVLILTN
ncbi:MAG TPA: hypothetical protein DIS78_06215 [Lachnospiraceae bacterium]|nr:hypothetical protein [Lachnospiraceae bacterium]